jgi:hypothetical protein
MSFQIAAGASATQVKKRCSRHDTEDRGLPHTLVLRANKVIDIRHAWCGARVRNWHKTDMAPVLRDVGYLVQTGLRDERYQDCCKAGNRNTGEYL